MKQRVGLRWYRERGEFGWVMLGGYWVAVAVIWGEGLELAVYWGPTGDTAEGSLLWKREKKWVIVR